MKEAEDRRAVDRAAEEARQEAVRKAIADHDARELAAAQKRLEPAKAAKR